MSLVAGAAAAPGEAKSPLLRPLGKPGDASVNLRTGTRPFSSQRPAQAENRDSGTAYMPRVAEWQLLPAFCCSPPASPVFVLGSGKQKTAPKDRSKKLISLEKSGAGEGIRTLDPNLGKVVLSGGEAARKDRQFNPTHATASASLVSIW